MKSPRLRTPARAARPLVVLTALLALAAAPALAGAAPPAPDGPIGFYTFVNTLGTYTELTGDTPFVVNGGSGSLDDGYSADQTIPFPFDFGGTVFTTYRVNTNGWLGFGSPTSTTNYSALNGSVNNVVAFCNRDMNNTGAVYSSVTEGSAPNRIHKIQAKNFYRYNTSTMTGNAQIWFYETTNVIEFHYGTFAQTWTSGSTVQVGLRGTSTGAASVRSLSGTGASTWTAPVLGNSSTSTMSLALTVTPDSGRTYTFTPAPAPNLDVSTKTANPTANRSGGTVDYTIVIQNGGDADALGATLADPIPTGAAYVPGSLGTVGSPAATYNGGTNTVEWGPADLAVGASVTVTFQVTLTAVAPATVTNTATINATNTAGPTTRSASTYVYVGCVAGGYYHCTDSNEPGGPVFSWLDATGGTLILDATTTGGDDRVAPVTMPFPFSYYGATSADLTVGDNGALVFGTLAGAVTYSNTPMASAPIDFIAPFWDDMDTDTGGTYTQVFGSAPNRIFVIEWFDRPHYSNVGAGSFEVLLFEGSQEIVFQYLDVDFGSASYNGGASATVGLRSGGAESTQYSYNAPSLTANRAVRYVPRVRIQLAKTVGTTPAVCAATTTITLPEGGGMVYYCFTATNTGEVTLSLHDLVDDQLGTIFTNATFTLPPGASVGMLVPHNVTVPTTNTATWTAYNPGPVDVASSSASATVNVIQPPPNADVSPASLSSALVAGAAETQTLNIGNTGVANLNWSITEEPVAAAVRVVRPATPAGKGDAGRALAVPAPGTTGSRGGRPDATAPISYQSPASFSEAFDDITLLPGAGWFFQNNSNPLGTTTWFQGNDTVFPAQAGAPTAYIGANYNNTAGTGTISNWMLTPEVALADGNTVSFWTRTVAASTYPDRLEVRLSTAGASTDVGSTETSVGVFTTVLQEINPSLAVGGYPEVWTQYTITLAGIPAGATGRIGFRYFVTDGGPNGANSNYIGIDTFEYTTTSTVACENPLDVPWLSVAPVSGVVAGGSSQPVDVTFDSAGLNCGASYTANLCVASDDPDPGPGNGTALVVVPVDLTVLCGPDIEVAPADLSSLQPIDTQVVLPLDISNLGDADLAWDIAEDAGLVGGVRVARVPGWQQPLLPNRHSPAPESAAARRTVTVGDKMFSAARVTAAKSVTPERLQAPDATVTITHSATQTITSGNSIACTYGSGQPHTNNSYIRYFTLADFGITGSLAVTQVEVGIELASGAGGSQPAIVNLYTWNPADPFVFANFVPIGSANATVPDQTLTIITVPVTGTVPAGGTLVVEFFTPDGLAAGDRLFVGSNADGQTAPTYLAAADCGIAEPTDVTVIGFPGMMLVMNVTGTTGCDADLTWASATPAAGTTGPGGTSPVDVTFDSTGLTMGGTYTGSLCVNSNDPDTPVVMVPLTLQVDTMPFLDGFETGDTSRWSITLP